MKNIPVYITALLICIGLEGWCQSSSITLSDATSGEYIATERIFLKPGFSSTNFYGKVLPDVYIPTALTANENYVFTRTYTKPFQNASEVSSNAEVVEQVTYFDGLGRPKQQVAIKASPNKKDIITHITYDRLGRQAKSILPFVAAQQNGAYHTVDVNQDINSYYQQKHPQDFIGVTEPEQVNPFSETIFERSPMGRTLEQAAPGKSWGYDPTNYELIGVTYKPMPGKYFGFTNKQWHTDFFFDPEKDQPEDGNQDSPRHKTEILINSFNFLTFTITGNPFGQFHRDGPQTGTLTLGKIDYVRTSRPLKDIDLGNILDASGNPTSYRLQIIDNYFVLSSDTPELQEVGMLSMNVTLDLNEPVIDDYERKEYLNRTVRFDYKTNTTDQVARFDVAGTQTEVSLVQNGSYDAGTLYLNITKDENWRYTDGHNHTTEEFKNKEGQVLLKRTYNQDIPHDTYYVYNELGNLSFVITPKVDITDGVSQIELDELCYQYKYDERGRLIEKKIPGKGWEYIVYNKLDQVVLTQDANMRKTNSGAAKDQWLFTKYDVLGRVVYTGLINDDTTRAELQTVAYDTETYTQYENKVEAAMLAGTTIYYSNTAWPMHIAEIYTINYYDDYNFDTAGINAPVTVFNQQVDTRTKSLATGSKVRVLGTADWVTTVTYYDGKARAIYTASKNDYLQTTDVVESQFDFAGKVLQTKATHSKGENAPIVTFDNFTYDHAGRVLAQTQVINGQRQSVTANTYDELGQLTTKEVGGGLQEVDYSYNIRGWMTGINGDTKNDGDLFNFSLSYDNPLHGATALYNGNISETTWKTASDNTERFYTYQYDHLNRLTAATDNENRYSVSNISYDKVGNIMTLQRGGHINEAATSFGVMDDLSYSYYANSNKLQRVDDRANINFGFSKLSNTTNAYTYDANGNMITDVNKGISNISYNNLSLPINVAISNIEGTGNISYIYDATGAKQKKIVSAGGSLIETDYAGNYQYKDGILQFFNHAEGYAEPENDGSFTYVYQYKDHLGNIRLSYADDDTNGSIATDEIRQEKNYYPYGLVQKGYNSVVRGRRHNFGFTGKEEQSELGLEWVDITARNYDPAIARWMNLDPLAEQMRRHSPYNYAFNNPIYFMDPDGMAPCSNGDCNKEGPLTEDQAKSEANKNSVPFFSTPKKTGDAKGPHVEDTDKGSRFYAYKAGGSIEGKDGLVEGKVGGNISGFSAGYEGYTEKGGAHGSASIYGVQGDVEARLGSEENNLAVNANGSVFKAEIKGDAGLYSGDNGKYGFELSGSASATALAGAVNPSVTILGYRVGFTIGGSVGSAHAGATARGIVNTKTKKVNVTGLVHVGLGAGFKLGFTVTNDAIKTYDTRKNKQ